MQFMEKGVGPARWRSLPNRECSMLERLDPLQRTHHTLETAYTYPVYFLNDRSHVQSLVGSEQMDRVVYGHAESLTGWGQAVIRCGDVSTRDVIERDFIVALASWFALLVMNNRATHYIHQFIHALAAGQREPTAIEAQAIRLAYIEASNQSLPIQWTSAEADLRLLESIHVSWSTNRWRNAVDRKTNLLAAHCEQMKHDADGDREHLIIKFGAIIGAFTLCSAIADVMKELPEDSPLREKSLVFMIGIPLLCVLFLFRYAFRRKPALL